MTSATVRLNKAALGTAISSRVTALGLTSLLAISLLVPMLARGAVADSVSSSIPMHGSWTVSVASGSDRRPDFDVSVIGPYESLSSGHDEAWSTLPGLRASDLTSAGRPVHFLVVRDAGTLHCQGRASGGHGTGTFTYQPSATFAAQLAKRGISPPSNDEQFRMTISDVSLDFIDTLERSGYHPSTPATLLGFVQHGVTKRFVSGLAAAGYRFHSADALAALVEHGVTLEFVRKMSELGYHASVDDLMRLVEHGVTADFVSQVTQRGDHPTVDELIRLRDGGSY